MKDYHIESDIYFDYNCSSTSGTFAVGLIPIVCPSCRYTFDDFKPYRGGRYGHVGMKRCPTCNGFINMTDNDCISGKVFYHYIRPGEENSNLWISEDEQIAVNFSSIYMLSGIFLKALKEVCGFDVLAQSGRDEKEKRELHSLKETLSSLKGFVDTTNHVVYNHSTTFFPKLPSIACEWRNAVVNIVNGTIKLKAGEYKPYFNYERKA